MGLGGLNWAVWIGGKTVPSTHRFPNATEAGNSAAADAMAAARDRWSKRWFRPQTGMLRTEPGCQSNGSK